MFQLHRSLYTVLFAVVALIITVQCSKSPSADDEQPDKTPPDAIANLAVVATTSHSVTLEWTAPHDYRADHSAGMVDGYDLRIAYESITAQNFAQQYRLDSVPAPGPAGYPQQCVVDNLEPDSMYYFALKSCDDKDNWSGISNCCNVHCPAIQVVIFADTAFERIVRAIVHKASGDILTSDVDTVIYVNAPFQHIANISGIEYFISVQGVALGGNELTDISPLTDLDQIWGLDVSSNHITDITPVASLGGLSQLSIADNPITDIGPLASVPTLRQLFMFATQVTDFSPLYGLENLSDVHFALLNLTDISFMSNLTHLKICKLNSNSITSLAPLAGLTTLEGLDLMINQISDLTPLGSLLNLHDLNLVYNNITDIQPLVDNAGLGAGDVVYLGGNPLSQQAVTVQIPALQARGVDVSW